MQPIIMWFRRDLRLADNPALEAARKTGAPILPLYVLDESPELRPAGAASRWWMDKSLASLAADLETRGSRLILRRGAAESVLREICVDNNAELVVFNSEFSPGQAAAEARLAETLRAHEIEVRRFNGGHLVHPDAVKTKAGGPYNVFTPFWRTARELVTNTDHIPAPRRLPTPDKWPRSDKLEDWKLHPAKPDWSGGFDGWSPGETGAAERLMTFVDQGLGTYSHDRDRPATEGTSRLSPHLHFGEISPKACWRAVEGRGGEAEKFRAELGWREFCCAINARGQDLAQENFDKRFDQFPWRHVPAELEAWKSGRTGYPIIDAGMRQLWTTGWMHNRVRMIVASFLTKHLLIDWREGEAWFWDTLVDADHASNAGNWQWVAGSGADAAPYFRIFNPMIQGAKFDPDGAYVRQWVPELARLSAKAIHTPWEASDAVLEGAGVRLGKTYPRPIVDHEAARKRALAAYAQMRADAAED